MQAIVYLVGKHGRILVRQGYPIADLNEIYSFKITSVFSFVVRAKQLH